jgi:hypothetical protein
MKKVCMSYKGDLYHYPACGIGEHGVIVKEKDKILGSKVSTVLAEAINDRLDTRRVATRSC